MKGNIAVLFGGISNENEISVITGTMAVNVLKSGGESVIPLYMDAFGELYADEKLSSVSAYKGDISKFSRARIAKNGIYILNSRGKVKKFIPVYCALNCCHGGAGEGGGACGLFEMNSIPLAGAGMFESAAFMDKYYTKLVLSALGVKVADYAYLRDLSDLSSAEKLGYPLIVKPAKLGSSIGVARVDDREGLIAALSAAFEYDDGAIVEKYFSDKREINCAAAFADGKLIISDCEEAFPSSGVFTYGDKYGGKGKSVLPADIPADVADGIKNTVNEVYSRLNMRGIVRFDFILSGGESYLSEINTVPGSLAYYLISGGFKKFYPVLAAVIAQAVADYRARRAKKILQTGILNDLPSNACTNIKK